MAFLSALLVMVAKITYWSVATRRGFWSGLGLEDAGVGEVSRYVTLDMKKVHSLLLAFVGLGH